MKKILFCSLILFAGCQNVAECQSQEINEFKQGKAKKFVSDGKAKGDGLRFSILYPNSYAPKDVGGPVIVKGFEHANGKVFYMVGVVNDKEGISEARKDALLTKENCEPSSPNLRKKYKFINFSERIKIRGFDATYIEFENELNSSICFNRHYYIIVGDYLVTLGFVIASASNNTIASTQKNYQPFIEKVVESFNIISYNKNAISKNEDFSVSEYMKYKDQAPEPDKSKANETWINELYRNKKYKFRVVFPKNWEYDGGTSKGTLARAFNREKAVAISIVVRQVDPPIKSKDSNNIHKMQAMTKDQMNTVLELQNMKVENFKSEKGYLNNFPAYLYESTSQQSAGTETYTYLSKQVQCLYGNKIYVLGINLPIENWDDEMMIQFDRVVKSFVFEIVF